MTVRILVADDSITIQKIVAMAFENEDAEVEGIGDGQKAFAVSYTHLTLPTKA